MATSIVLNKIEMLCACGAEVNATDGGGLDLSASAESDAEDLCFQSLTLPDLRTIQHGPKDHFFTPYFFGSFAHSPPVWNPDDVTGNPYPELLTPHATNLLSWSPNGWSRAMGFMAWLSGDSGVSW